MRWIPSVGDVVQSRHTREMGEVTEVNKYWGWFKVHYDNDTIRVYKISKTHENSVILRKASKLSKEARADALLRKENSGITDFWRE